MDVGTAPILLEVDEGLPLSVDRTGEVDVDVEVDDEEGAVVGGMLLLCFFSMFDQSLSLADVVRSSSTTRLLLLLV
jgi:hypothetical protein